MSSVSILTLIYKSLYIDTKDWEGLFNAYVEDNHIGKFYVNTILNNYSETLIEFAYGTNQEINDLIWLENGINIPAKRMEKLEHMLGIGNEDKISYMEEKVKGYNKYISDMGLVEMGYNLDPMTTKNLELDELYYVVDEKQIIKAFTNMFSAYMGEVLDELSNRFSIEDYDMESLFWKTLREVCQVTVDDLSKIYYTTKLPIALELPFHIKGADYSLYRKEYLRELVRRSKNPSILSNLELEDNGYKLLVMGIPLTKDYVEKELPTTVGQYFKLVESNGIEYYLGHIYLTKKHTFIEESR